MLWDLNYLDKASTAAEEVEDADRKFFRAIFGEVALMVGLYLVSLLTGIGAMEVERSGEWSDGILRRPRW